MNSNHWSRVSNKLNHRSQLPLLLIRCLASRILQRRCRVIVNQSGLTSAPLRVVNSSTISSRKEKCTQLIILVRWWNPTTNTSLWRFSTIWREWQRPSSDGPSSLSTSSCWHSTYASTVEKWLLWNLSSDVKILLCTKSKWSYIQIVTIFLLSVFSITLINETITKLFKQKCLVWMIDSLMIYGDLN